MFKKGVNLTNDQQLYLKMHFDGMINRVNKENGKILSEQENGYMNEFLMENEPNITQNTAIKYKIKPMASQGILNKKGILQTKGR